LDGVDFEVRAGEVYVLLGENGADKSTLVKVLAGVYTPDAGRVLIDGLPVWSPSPPRAHELGIAVIYQKPTWLTCASSAFGLVFITHHLQECRRISDRITVLHDGRSVGVLPAGTGVEQMIELMVSRSIDKQYPRRAQRPGEVLLKVDRRTRTGVFSGVSFEVRAARWSASPA
jgi:ABC-type sugar transport system ATPase subunit